MLTPHHTHCRRTRRRNREPDAVTESPTAPRREQADTANVEFAQFSPDPTDLIGISPTDVSQYIRLEQCARYLRLRLYEREAGSISCGPMGCHRSNCPHCSAGPVLTSSEASTTHLPKDTTSSTSPPTGRKRLRRENDRLLAHLVRSGAVRPWSLRGPLPSNPNQRLAHPRRGRSGAYRPCGRWHALAPDHRHQELCPGEGRGLPSGRLLRRNLDALLRDAGYGTVPIDLGIVFVAQAEGDTRLTDDDKKRLEARQAAYVDTFGPGPGLLDTVADPQQYRDAVSDLVTGPDANARALATAEFDSLPFHLTGKCDNCIYNEFCLRRSADTDDLSLLPLLTARDKAALQRNTIQTVSDVATLKHQDGARLVADPASIELVRKLSGTWPIGSRLDELVHRARRYRAYKGDDLTYLSYIPDSGYSSLPSSRPDLNPNLVLVYIDVQLDHLQDRVYQVAALVVGHEAGSATPQRRRTVIATTEGPPESLEREGHLFINWIADVLTAVAKVAAPDADGQIKGADPSDLLRCLHAEDPARWTGAAPRSGAGDDAAVRLRHPDRCLRLADPDPSQEPVRAQNSYPLLAQTLQSVSAWLRFPWKPEIRQTLRHRLFDSLGRMQGTSPTDLEQGDAYYVRRARFTSQVPLEYAYAALGTPCRPLH